MIEINEQIEIQLKKLNINQIGSFFQEMEAFTDDETEFVLYYTKDKIYLAHISEFEQQGLFIRLKEK